MSAETVLFRGSPSLILKAGSFLGGIVLMAGFIAAAVYFNQPVIALGAGAVMAYLIGVIIYIRTEVFEVTSERLRWTRGILNKRTDELELYRVTDVSLVEPFLFRLAGAGNIEIHCADVTTPHLTLPAVKQPRELREQLRLSIEQCRDRKRVRVTELEGGDPSTS